MQWGESLPPLTDIANYFSIVVTGIWIILNHPANLRIRRSYAPAYEWKGTPWPRLTLTRAALVADAMKVKSDLGCALPVYCETWAGRLPANGPKIRVRPQWYIVSAGKQKHELSREQEKKGDQRGTALATCCWGLLQFLAVFPGRPSDRVLYTHYWRPLAHSLCLLRSSVATLPSALASNNASCLSHHQPPLQWQTLSLHPHDSHRRTQWPLWHRTFPDVVRVQGIIRQFVQRALQVDVCFTTGAQSNTDYRTWWVFLS